MRPVLFEIAVNGRSVAVGSYGAMVILALVVGSLGAWLLAVRAGFDRRRTAVLAACTAVSFLIGARFFFALTHLVKYMDDPLRLFAIATTNFSLYGGLIAAVLTAFPLCRRLKLDVRALGDVVVPAVGFSFIIAKLGCFLNGCCIGKSSGLPWAVALPGKEIDVPPVSGVFGNLSGLIEQTAAHPAPTHPAAVYEMIGAALAVVLALAVPKWIGARTDRGAKAARLIPGVRFLLFLFFFTAARWAVFYYRHIPSAIDAWIYPAVYAIVLVVVGATLRRIITNSSIT